MNRSKLEADERITPNKGGVTYDQILHAYRYEKARNVILQYVQNERPRILDCACGNGYSSKILSEVGDYHGVDISENAIEYAQQNYGSFGKFALITDGNTPFDNEFFDVVVSIETIEHLEKAEHTQFLDMLSDKLKHNGILIISTPNRDYPYKKLLQRRGWRNPFHLYEYNYREFLSKLGRMEEFEIVGHFGIGGPFPWPVSRLSGIPVLGTLARLSTGPVIAMGTFIKPWANTIMVVARKK